MEDKLSIYSSVPLPLLKKALFRGSIFAAIGAVLILYSGIFVPVKLLNSWGFLVVTLGILLIANGLIPYRRLTKLQLKPYEIIIDIHGFSFRSEGKQRFTVPRKIVKRCEYLLKSDQYGIAIWLDKSCTKKILVQDANFDMRKFQNKSSNYFSCDLFFPFFKEKDYQELLEAWSDVD
ncbi:MAG: hypothetical protein CMO81_12075 [Waddliaceae bacterium]|nr:hypothetical protein [Waddliaceae bacterium]|tara:strand:+ start:317 stop:847 length:531 start_codon:yes stop_codon:yes gene_type:complete